ncbi:MAG: DUF2628 domain-containing protein [Leptothrix ochracea]|uniref:DUF2628 domain-containing protein n=1 Tax=Leptothrix ochracea TaxID=735331 RepID=UPI0034E2A994
MLYCQSCNTDNSSQATRCQDCGCPYLLPYAVVLARRDGKLKGVKSGFNLPAALFGFVWAAYHRAWNLALFLFLFSLALVAFNSQLAAGTNSLLLMIAFQAAYMVIRGMYANKWLLQALKRKGYSERTTPN